MLVLMYSHWDQNLCVVVFKFHPGTFSKKIFYHLKLFKMARFNKNKISWKLWCFLREIKCHFIKTLKLFLVQAWQQQKKILKTLLVVHCKYLRPNYDGTTGYHRTSSIIRCNVPLPLNIPIATITYSKIYSGMIVKCQ